MRLEPQSILHFIELKFSFKHERVIFQENINMYENTVIWEHKPSESKSGLDNHEEM